MINDRYVAFLKSAYEEASKKVSGIYERDKKLGMKLPKWISFKGPLYLCDGHLFLAAFLRIELRFFADRAFALAGARVEGRPGEIEDALSEQKRNPARRGVAMSTMSFAS